MKIKNEIQFQAALSRALSLMSVTDRQAEGAEFTALVDDIMEYERRLVTDTNAVKSST